MKNIMNIFAEFKQSNPCVNNCSLSDSGMNHILFREPIVKIRKIRFSHLKVNQTTILSYTLDTGMEFSFVFTVLIQIYFFLYKTYICTIMSYQNF